MPQQTLLAGDTPAPLEPMRERGVTRLDIVLHTIAETETKFAAVCARIRDTRKLQAEEREELSRRLAGVVGNCETLRVWLEAGAKR